MLESNGSSSMGSTCASSLALMDAGVPLKDKAHVGGIAMGLVMEDGKYVILSDIQGLEDSSGDMDFKVAGTKRGITALQMDIKCSGISSEIMEAALEQARQGRFFIIKAMSRRCRAASGGVAERPQDASAIGTGRQDRHTHRAWWEEHQGSYREVRR